MIVFSGDRSSLTIRCGKWLQKKLGKNLICVRLWDGYKSTIFWEEV